MSALRMLFASLLASTALSGAAFAQDNTIPGDGPRGYEVRPPTSPPAGRFPGRGEVGVDVNQEPRFIVEAISFKAVDESDYDYPYTSDEIFAVFTVGDLSTVTSNFEQVDTGDTERFPRHQSCIWPAIDPDDEPNGRWSCDPAGGAGPVAFRVTLYDDDVERPNFGFSVWATDIRGGYSTGSANDTVFRGEFRYQTSDIVQRLRPDCRCFTRTVRHSVDDETTYEFTFRITMVDGGNDNVLLDPGIGGGGTPAVHRSGTLSAGLSQHFEFDGGAIVGSNGDFSFTRSGAAFRLTPVSGARIWVGGTSARGYAACAAGGANYSANAVNIPAAGAFACYMTSDGRFGEFRVDSLEQMGIINATLTLSYTTWQ